VSDLSPNRTLIVDLPGPDLTPDQGRFLSQHGFGGVCLFARNITAPERTARLICDLRDALGHDALVATDQEGGAVLRRLDVPLPPTPQALGVIGSEAAAREAGAVAARGLIELGINWNFAPSLDVNSNPRNPVIGERSFNADPAEVARLGVAWALGSEAAGVMASVKHFPGHGDTAQDSHLTLPTVAKLRAELEATEWLPFRAAAQAGVGSVMTAHILYPALDPARPATLSRAALTGLLRQDWGYDGVVVTDATDMRAIADHYPRGAAAPAALAAGADAVLSCGHGSLALHAQNAAALAEALTAGTLSAERLAEAQARLAGAALRFPGTPRPYPPAQHGADEQAVQDWAARSLRWQGTPPALDPARPVLLVAPESAALGGPYGDFLGGEALATSLRGVFPHLQVALHGGHDSGTAEALLAQFPGAPVLLATTGRWGVSAAETRLAAGLRQSRRPALHLALWSPETVEALGLPAIVTHGFRPANLRALGAALATLRLHAPH
jgi:beta-N-acetylhexosaminidase